MILPESARAERCRQKIIAAINEAELPYIASYLLLESLMLTVRISMMDAEKTTQDRKGEQE